jgi:proline racemase
MKESDLRKRIARWSPPYTYGRITAIDAHTEGEPLRIIIDGFPDIPGSTILERRRYLKDHLDHLRTSIMWEPRGHSEMYGCLVTAPVTPGADFGVLFMHNEGYSTMCGHGIIAITTVAVETGLVPTQEPITTVRIDSPAGQITAYARMTAGTVQSVFFHNVPSFVLALDEIVQVPGLGPIRYDLAFGGAFYAYVRADQVGLKCLPEENAQLVEKGMRIKRAVMASRPIPHPFQEDLSFLYGTIFIAPAVGKGSDSRNVCIFANGEVDRSPTGTGVSGRMALHYARGEVKTGEPIVIESIIGSRFTGRVVSETTFGPYKAIIPEVEGTAHITGMQTLLIDPDDPLRAGFII